ncbi:MAG TPA: hypothetical protein VMZ26_13945 [Pyrinomonadaceae bacterium]|nr:hypothetical protein [Pyrinomonadaceae bacterium]
MPVLADISVPLAPPDDALAQGDLAAFEILLPAAVSIFTRYRRHGHRRYLKVTLNNPTSSGTRRRASDLVSFLYVLERTDKIHTPPYNRV